MLAWASNQISRILKKSRYANADLHTHRDIYGRVVEHGEDFFHPREFRGIPIFDVDSILRHYKPQLDDIKSHFIIGEQRMTPDGRPMYDALISDIVRRYIEFAHMIPASEDHHHSHTGGLLLHSLEVSLASLRWAKEKSPPFTGYVDKDAKVKPVMIYCAWLAGLLHDAGKLMRDISIDAVEVLDAKGNVSKPPQNIVSWHPARESLIEWARDHNIVTYSCNFVHGRIHNRHNIDSSQILQPLLRHQYAMEFILSTPIKQDVYNDLTRVLSGYTSNTDFLSESVRIGDSDSTARSLGYVYDTRLGSRPISTAHRLVRSIQSAAKDWHFNRDNGQGWIIGGDVYLRWSSTIENIVDVSKLLGYALPVDVKNILNIMESNLLLDLFSKKAPDDRIIRFSPGKFDKATIADIRADKLNVVWHYLLKLRGPELIFSDVPMPYSVPGLIYLPIADAYYVLDADGDITYCSLDDKTPLTTVSSADVQEKLAEPKQGETPPDPNIQAPQITSSTAKAPEIEDDAPITPTQESDHPTINILPGKSKRAGGLNGISFSNLDNAKQNKTDKKNTGTPAKPKAASKKAKQTKAQTKGDSQSQKKTKKPNETLAAILSHKVRTFQDGEATLVVLEDLEALYGIKHRAVIAKMDKQGELYIDLANPSKRTFTFSGESDTKYKCLRLSADLVTKLEKAKGSNSVSSTNMGNEPEFSASASETRLDDSVESSDGNTSPINASALPTTAAPSLSPAITEKKSVTHDVSKHLDHNDDVNAEVTLAPEYQSLLHLADKSSMLQFIYNHGHVNYIKFDEHGNYFIKTTRMPQSLRKTINVSRLTNYFSSRNIPNSNKGYQLTLKQLKQIQLDEVCYE